MPFTASFFFCVVVVPIWVQIGGRSPAALFAVTALIHIIFVTVAMFQPYALAVNLQGHGPTKLRAFNTIGHIRIPVNLAFILMIFAAITWLQSRFDVMHFSMATNALFWVFHLSALVSGTYLVNVLGWPVRPSDHVNHLNFLELLSSISPLASYGATYSVIALVGLAFLSVSQLFWTKFAP